MNRRVLAALLLAEALVCLALALNGGGAEWAAFTAVVGFPWRPLAGGLRALSLSGGWGNLVAVVGYLAFSLLPLAYFVYRWRRWRRWPELLLPGLSLLLLAGLYLLINPAYIERLLHYAPSLLPAAQNALCMCLWSPILCYLVLRLLDASTGADTAGLLSALDWLLAAIAVVLVWSMLGQGLSQLLSKWQQVRAVNTGVADLAPTLAALILRWLLECLPAALDLWIVGHCLRLTRAWAADGFGAATQAAAEALARVSRLTVIVVAGAGLAANLLQFLAGSQLYDVNYVLRLPLTAIAFALAALLLARYCARGRELKTDNDLLI